VALTLNDKGYFYKGTNIVTLAAKCQGESLSGVGTYIDQNTNTPFDFPYDGTFSYIPYTTSVLGGLWGAYRADFATSFRGSTTALDKLYTVAARGCCPIPHRYGLGNNSSAYIGKVSKSFTAGYTYTLTWNSTNKNITLTSSKSGEATSTISARCVVIDVVGRGGQGGTGTTSGAVRYSAGGGGGGCGGAGSFIVDMSKASKITFDNTSSTALYVKNKDGNTFLTLNTGNKGGNAKGGQLGNYGEGATGGTASSNSTYATTSGGLKVLWTGQNTNHGGHGGGINGTLGQSCGGLGGGYFKSKVTFIGSNWANAVKGGDGGQSVAHCAAGGGGLSSFLGRGGQGDWKGGSPTAAGRGGGGGGGVGRSDESSGTSHAGLAGGPAGIDIYYEGAGANPYTTACTNYDSGDGPTASNGANNGVTTPPSTGGCLFAGTEVALDSTTSIDISEFIGGTPIDFCNPDTLEHFPQQTLANLWYAHATRKITIELEDGKTLSMTANHPILTKEGFKSYLYDHMFPKYDLGDFVATIDGYKQIIGIQDEPIEETKVYNIITENSLIVANGIIVGGELEYSIDPALIDGGGNFGPGFEKKAV
jgi:hypothetical protein